jgi:2-polyprenyl-6-methoxyphenol hydroxylase-like FAD-dependent oxidoreductase
LLCYLGFHTASYLFSDDALGAQFGRQFRVVAEPDRQLGLYPTNDGRLAASFTHRNPEPRLPTDPAAALHDTYRDMGDLVCEALAGCPTGDGLYYDQVAQIELDSWSSGRVVLVGDACQAVSLLAGQGAALAMGGAYILAQELRRAAPREAAIRYEQRMRPFVRDRQRSGRRTAQWLVPGSRWRITARALTFAAARVARAALTGPAGPAASVVTEPTAQVHR